MDPQDGGKRKQPISDTTMEKKTLNTFRETRTLNRAMDPDREEAPWFQKKAEGKKGKNIGNGIGVVEKQYLQQ